MHDGERHTKEEGGEKFVQFMPQPLLTKQHTVERRSPFIFMSSGQTPKVFRTNCISLVLQFQMRSSGRGGGVGGNWESKNGYNSTSDDDDANNDQASNSGRMAGVMVTRSRRYSGQHQQDMDGGGSDNTYAEANLLTGSNGIRAAGGYGEKNFLRQIGFLSIL